MASNAEIQSFVKTWTPAAIAASAALNIPASFILAQWGMETGWGTQPNMGQNNPGNVGNLGGGKFQDYSSQQSFVNEYVASMRADFPALKNPKTQPKYEHVLASPWIYMLQIFNGSNSYDPGDTTYGDKVSGAYNTLVSAMGKGSGDSLDNYLHGKGTAMISVMNPSTGTSENVPGAVSDATAGALSKLTATLQRGGLALLGGILAIVGIFILTRGEVVERVTKSL